MTQGKHKNLIVMIALAVTTLAVYWQVRNFEFVSFDDTKYVRDNSYVNSGFTRQGLVWAFTDSISYWHPLTWISYMLDCQLFGVNAGGHHIVNLLLHIINALLLFTVIRRITDCLWQSAFVAALFALHPLRVESVAWIVERKDVLSGLFWMLTMLAYLRYVKNRRLVSYLSVLVIFSLALMAKPTVAALPFVLLLLDYWPLNRFANLSSAPPQKILRSLVLEKVPFFVLSIAAVCISSILTQRLGSAISLKAVPMTLRIENAIVSYVKYIGMLAWPVNMAVFYPYPASMPLWQVVAALLVLLLLFALMFRTAGTRPYFLVGGLWFIGSLLPSIGIVQAGLWPAVADRFTYLPAIGAFIAVTWGANDLLQKWKYKQIVLGLSAFAVIAILTVLTWFQVGCWRDSISLFGHAVEVTNRNNFAYNNRGTAYAERGESKLAISDFNKAIEIDPKFANVYYNRGNVYKNTGRYDLAIADYDKATEINPKYAAAYYNRALTYKSLGQYDMAIADYSKAIEINPTDADFYNNRGNAYKNKGEYDLAILDYNKAIEINPRYALAYLNKANVYELTGYRKEAIEAYKTFINCAPSDYEPYIERAKRRIKALEH